LQLTQAAWLSLKGEADIDPARVGKRRGQSEDRFHRLGIMFERSPKRSD
jgi:hypothetical protein